VSIRKGKGRKKSSLEERKVEESLKEVDIDKESRKLFPGCDCCSTGAVKQECTDSKGV
jgi:hypothetical protein